MSLRTIALDEGSISARRCALSPYARAAGFTAVELIVVVAIVGVLAAIAGPSFADLIASQRAASAATDLHVALATARSEATKRNADVTLSRKSGNWKNGWQVLDSASNVLLDHNAFETATITGSLASVVYQSSGRVSGTTKPTFAVTMTLGSTTVTKYVCVDLSGRPFTQASSCP
jgi:type IV fimbrial biogenesis protein FimT